MKKRFILYALILTSLTSVGQNPLEKLSDFFHKNLILDNNIDQILIEFNNGETQKLIFNDNGNILLEIQSKNWHSSDTSVISYKYENEELTEVLHLNYSTGDTLDFEKYQYENGLLKRISGTNLTNTVNTYFHYSSTGKLSKKAYSMHGNTSLKLLQTDTTYFDSMERKTKLARYVGNKSDIFSWLYTEGRIEINRVYTIHENQITNLLVYLNSNNQPTKLENEVLAEDSSISKTTTTLLYDDNDCLNEIRINEEKLLSVEIGYK